MGAVYAAFDPGLNRKVALKFLHPDGEDSHARLLREAQAMAQLRHPNVVTVHDVGLLGSRPFVAMEFVEGSTLRQWLRGGPRPWREILHRFLLAGRGLLAAHEAGLVHRDFKPENVLIGNDGRVCVTDFGLARSYGAPGAPAAAPSAAPPELPSAVTVTGTLVGTPAYMSPEQRAGEDVDARSDQYSFCVALWEALVGSHPATSPPERAHEIPPWTTEVLTRGLREDRQQRWPSMAELLNALEADPESRRRRRWKLAVLALVAVAGTSGVWLAIDRARSAVCRGAAERLVGAWDEARREQVRAAFLSTAAPFAQAAWAKVRAGLEGYATAWVSRREDVCAATHIRKEQSEALLDRRMSCLDQRLRELRAVVDVFAAADRTVVARAARAVEELPDPQGCEHAGERATETRTRADVERIGNELAQVRALVAAGKYREALPKAAASLRLVEAGGGGALLAEALYRLADVQSHLRDTAGAAHLRRALPLAVSAGADALAARCAIALALSLPQDAASLPERRSLLELARAHSERMGGDDDLTIRRLSALGLVLHEAGKYAEALEPLARGRALALRRGRVLDELNLRRQSALSLSRLERHEEAIALAREAALAYERQHGPDHPEVAAALNVLGGVLINANKYDEAIAPLQRALEVKRRALGPTNFGLSGAHENLAIALLRAGREGEAMEHFRQALDIARRGRAADDPSMEKLLTNYGSALINLYRYADALPVLAESLRLARIRLGTDHPLLAWNLNNLAHTYTRLGRASDAIPLLLEAKTLLERTLGARSPKVARTLVGLGRAELVLGRIPAALRSFESAVSIYESAKAPLPGEIATALTELGEARLRARQPALARVALERAIVLRPEKAAFARFALARALWEGGGDRARALQLARQARSADVGEAPWVRELRAWLARHDRGRR
jgi:tetratricopeptide (TPR) repeat protein